MQGTRERILDVVVQQREVRVDDLATELSITPAAVRRHLDHLRADGLVDARAVRQPTGRPFYVYFPTERARGVLPPAYARLLEGVLQGLGDKPEIMEGVLVAIAETMAARHRGEAAEADDPVARLDYVTGSLREEGILETWSPGADGIHLVNHQCPYIKAASISKLPCESDRKTIELLLGLDVEQRHRIVDGSPICEYVIRNETHETALSPEAESRSER